MGGTEKKACENERASGRRKQVLDAAQVCFARSGFHGASMAQISKAAGMSAGHIYNYFDSKDAIIAAFVQANLERTTAILRDIGKNEDVLRAMVDEVGNSVREILDGSNIALQLEIFAEAARNPVIAALVQEADRATLSQLCELVARGRAARGLSVEATAIRGRCEALAALMEGLYVRAVENPLLEREALIRSIQISFEPLLLSA